MKVTGPFRDKKKRAMGFPKTWYLRVVAPRLNPDGSPVVDSAGKVLLRRERPYYATKQEAEADIPRLLGQHNAAGVGAGGVLSREQLADLEQARWTVPEVALAVMADFWRLHHPRQAASPLRDLIPAFLAEIEARNGKTRHHSDLKSRLSMFAAVMGDRLPATVTRNEILGYLLNLGKGGRTVLNQKRAICTFFNWLLEKSIIETNPAGGIKRRLLPKFHGKEIGFLSLVDAVRYLRAAERYDPDLVAHEVVQFFSGVRADDEMADFRGEWVMPATREIVIPAAAAKMERREVIAGLEGNFWTWWEVYGVSEGLLRPANYEQRWKRVRILAGIEARAAADDLARLPIKTLIARPEAKAALTAWPWNARRRTFCTYHVAKHQSADRTALILRHKGQAGILHDSYRGLGVPPAQGEAYFAILPNKVAKPILPVRPNRGIIRLQFARRQAVATHEVASA